MKKRSGFVFTMVAMFGMALLGMVTFIAVLSIFIGVIVPTIPDILTDVPTLYDYDEFGLRITEIDNSLILNSNATNFEIKSIQSEINELRILMGEAITNSDYPLYEDYKSQVIILEEKLNGFDFQGFSQPNQRLELYWLFAWPSIVALMFFITFASASHFFEKSFGIFQRGTSSQILKTSIIGIVAIIIIPEFWDIYAIHMKQFSMYLLDPFNGTPEVTTQRLWCKMGCIVNLEDLLDQNHWSIALSNPSNFGQALLTDILLPLFKILPTAMVTLSFFVIAKVRVLFIMIILITLPIWMVGMNVPKIKEISHDMINNMIGASIAPIFSALTLSVGLTYIDTANSPALEEWISVLAIAIFASVWPIILAPKLSIIASQTSSILQTAIQSTAMMSANASSGMASGMASSGAMGNGSMGTGNQIKTLLASGMGGAMMNGVNGMTPANIPSDVRGNFSSSIDQGLGQNAMVGNVSSINSSNPSMVDPQINNGMMHNPGNHMNSMGNMDQGNSMIKNDPQYQTMLDNKTTHLPESQQVSARNTLDMGYRNNPSSVVEDMNTNSLSSVK